MAAFRFRNRRPHHRRNGYTLVVFVMLVFGIMGLAAIVIDIGFARLAQRQMQSAADTSALEGLRGRDRDDVSDPELSRRQMASQFVAWTFDDDLNPDSGDDRRLGAGPLLNLTGGASDTELNASQLLTLPTTTAYKPQRGDGEFGLELNVANDGHGDMVTGSYDSDQAHHEHANYERSDFDVSATNADAFLVRMRRSNDFLGLDSQDGVSSRGPAVPILFGRAALLRAIDSTTDFSPRHHGVTVRATAIAQARPACSIGIADDSAAPALLGMILLALEDSYWNDLTTDTADSQAIAADGKIGTGTMVGQFFDLGPVEQMPVVIGRTLPTSAAASAGNHFGYVPIYASIADGNSPPNSINRIVGFGLVDVAVTGADISIKRRASRVAHENASAILAFGLEISGDQLTAVLDANQNIEEPLLAPASVR